ncbi:UDP-N-acetylmuramyl pentapeptide phosphotransferase [Brevibacillus sp. H7]|uniref:UDP-N-acetylmuramyl pentapeptide phosphotransferase n=1 Tax=Brevibacillus sp. H7 TaxID=3349138 RepID=UPI0038214D44
MQVTVPVLLGLGVPGLLHLMGFTLIGRWLGSAGMIRKNYQGENVLTAGGVFLAVYSAIPAVILFFVSGLESEATVCLTGSLAAALFGWQDDRSPDRDKEAKGFRGHLRMLWQERRVTSGLWKAVGGGITALLVSNALCDGFVLVMVTAGLLALTTNLVNLFDLRPARAIKVFWLLLAISFAVGFPMSVQLSGWGWILPVLTATILLFPYDARGRLMLGDTGANYLGFVAGSCLVTNAPFSVQAGLLVLFAALHLIAERVSFSRVIQSVEWLRRLDQWGRQKPRNQTDRM